jgi:hypothetical protein
MGTKLQTAHTNPANGTQNPPISYGSNVTAASLLTIEVSYSAGDSITSIDDNKGNIWALAVAITQTSDSQRNELWYAMNAIAGATTVTVHFASGPNFQSLTIMESSGVATSAALDKTGAAIGTSAAYNSGNVTPTTNGQYLVGGLYANAGAVTADGSWVLENNADNQATIADQTQSTAAAIAFSGTCANLPWGAKIATFKALASTPAPSTQNTTIPTTIGTSISKKTVILGY